MPTPHLHDLAISAVGYDVCLVAELTTLLAGRLAESPVWSGSSSCLPGMIVGRLHEDASRVALLLPQRLWGHDKITASEAEILRERARRAPASVIAVTLDDDPRPTWMQRLRHRRLEAVGVAGAVEFVLRTIADAGGLVASDSPAPAPEPAQLATRWPEAPAPYLRQSRAHSGLRRALDSLSDLLESEGRCEMQVLPNRIVARVDGVGVSFSWMASKDGTVAGGRLMVIEWTDIAPIRGPGAFRTARATREQVYTAEATNPDDWHWRADSLHGRASSTANLAGEWMDGAAMLATLQGS